MLYSSIFNRYKDKNNVPFYNILKKVQLPGDKTSELYESYTVPYTIPWILLGYKIYGDINLFWLVQAANIEKKLNPMYAEVGMKLHIVKQAYVNDILEGLSNNNV